MEKSAMDQKDVELIVERTKRLFISLSNQTIYSKNESFYTNATDFLDINGNQINLFHSLGFEIFLIFIYSVVFLVCFIGNSLVIAVLALNRETQNATNYFLLNLAIADLCVALFCVYQNLSVYIFSEWSFGDLMCRMYHFVHALSYTASVYILVVISIERYLALVYPLLSRALLTMKTMKITINVVWLLSAICCFPRFIIFGTTNIDLGSGSKTFCVLKQSIYDAKLYDVVYISLCFTIPLLIISVSYLRICYHFWTSPLPGYSLTANRTSTSGCSTGAGNGVGVRQNSSITCLSESSITLIRKRRKKVIKLLITIVFAFALFSAPFHARKLCQHFMRSYDVSSVYATIFTIFTTLLLYSNSGVNPLIYLIFSKKLRRLMIDVVKRVINQSICAERPKTPYPTENLWVMYHPNHVISNHTNTPHNSDNNNYSIEMRSSKQSDV